jgi:arylsulfatase A-like enzyme
VSRSASLLVLSCLAGCGETSPQTPPPNVVIVLWDTVRPDHLELYGYPRATAPFVAEVGARGAVFPRAYSSSAWTVPAIASVFTGLYPTGHGMVNAYEGNEWMAKQIAGGKEVTVEVTSLPEEHATLPERLKSAGYATFGVATNTHASAPFGYDRGFDTFEMRRNEKAESVVDSLIARRDELLSPERPYFLYLHLNDVHKPYDPRKPWYKPGEDQRTDQIARYDSEISYLDAHVRRLSDALDWEQDTLVCLISDHGEAFLEHGKYGHSLSLYTELNRVLMVFAGPGVAPGEIDANASLVDVAPTILDFAGLHAGAMDGQSLRGLLDAERRADEELRLSERVLFAHRLGIEELTFETEMVKRHLWSVQRGPWRLIRDELEGRTLLYNLEEDRLEQKDLYAQEPERARALEALLEPFAAQGIRADGKTVSVEIDEDLFEDLEKMGYIEGSSD